jgi:hypothetical protein
VCAPRGGFAGGDYSHSGAGKSTYCRPARRTNHRDWPAFGMRYDGIAFATTFNETNESQEAQLEKPSPTTGAFQPE